MRMLSIILLVCCVHVSAKTSSQTITFSGKNLGLEKVFSEIERQSGYMIFCNYDLLRNAKPVTIQARKMPVEQLLRTILSGQSLDYTINKTTITIRTLMNREPGERDKLLAEPDLSVSFVPITGRITDAAGKPVAGASILVRGTKSGVVTDASGTFSINADMGSTLVISSVGYGTEEIKVTGKLVTVILKQAVSTLDESLVQAYGTTSRRLNTGNIAKVTAAEIERQPVGNPLAALQGRVPGMLVTQTTGMPGGLFQVEIRGRTAIDKVITTDAPLFIIDGIPIEAGVLNPFSSALGLVSGAKYNYRGSSVMDGINPQEIESIEVLKDADATAIYGSRGAGGVILITTKRGKAGRTSVDINVYQGVSNVANPTQMMNTQQYLAMRRLAFKTENAQMTIKNAYDMLLWDTTRYTNIGKLITDNTALMQNAQLSLSGGNEFTQFSVRGGYRKESTALSKDHSNTRGSINYTVSHQSSNSRFKILFSGSYSHGINDVSVSDISPSVLVSPPNLRLYDENGNLAWNEGGVSQSNPLSGLLEESKSISKSLFQSVQPSILVTKDLTLRVNIGYNTNVIDQVTKTPQTSNNPLSLAMVRRVQSGNNENSSWIIEPQAEYKKTIGMHKFNFLIGGTSQALDSKGVSVTASDFPSDQALISITNAAVIKAVDRSAQYRYLALFGRLNYNLKDKYILNLTGRRDGSSRFGPGSQYANFGAVGAAWIMSKEQFLSGKLSWLSFAKLRGSYGITGNDKIVDYNYLDTWITQSFTTADPGQVYLYPNKLYNPDYHWEQTNKLEAGIELGFLKDRVLIAATYYNNRSSNQLVDYKLPVATGFSSVVQNFPATVENAGLEFTLSANKLRLGDVSWTVSGNLTVPHNRLVAFPGLSSSSYASSLKVGKSLNQLYLYKYTGVNPVTGLYTVEDLDKNGVYNTLDYQDAGSLDPRFYGGIQNSFSYKGFDFDFFFLFKNQIGKNYRAAYASLVFTPGNIINLPAKMTDFWTPDNPNASLQRLEAIAKSSTSTAISNYANSGGIYGDASFIRLNNVSLSYSLPAAIAQKIRSTRIRLYVLAQNLLTITQYEVGDPETQSIRSVPPMRSITGGLQITF